MRDCFLWVSFIGLVFLFGTKPFKFRLISASISTNQSSAIRYNDNTSNMLRNTIRHNFFRQFHRNSTSTQIKASRLSTKRILLAAVAGSIAYDGYNEFEICGGISRFLRSLRIAAQISFDYSWHLYGVSENDEGYDKVIMAISCCQ